MQLSLFFFISSQFGRSCIGHKKNQEHPTLTKYCFHIFLAHPNLESTGNTSWAWTLEILKPVFQAQELGEKYLSSWILFPNGWFCGFSTSECCSGWVRMQTWVSLVPPCPPGWGTQSQHSPGGTKPSTMLCTHPFSHRPNSSVLQQY